MVMTIIAVGLLSVTIVYQQIRIEKLRRQIRIIERSREITRLYNS